MDLIHKTRHWRFSHFMVLLLSLCLNQSHTCKRTPWPICTHKPPTLAWQLLVFGSHRPLRPDTEPYLFTFQRLPLNPGDVDADYCSECGSHFADTILPHKLRSPHVYQVPSTVLTQSPGHTRPALSTSDSCLRAEYLLAHGPVPVPPMSLLVWLALLFGHIVSSLSLYTPSLAEVLYITRDWTTSDRDFTEVTQALAGRSD